MGSLEVPRKYLKNRFQLQQSYLHHAKAAQHNHVPHCEFELSFWDALFSTVSIQASGHGANPWLAFGWFTESPMTRSAWKHTHTRTSSHVSSQHPRTRHTLFQGSQIKYWAPVCIKQYTLCLPMLACSHTHTHICLLPNPQSVKKDSSAGGCL